MTHKELALNSGQLGIWFGQHLGVPSQSYNVSQYTEIHGPLDADLLAAATRQAAEEAEAVRVAFRETPEGPRQVLPPVADWQPGRVDVSGEPDPERAAHAWMRAELAAPVELVGGGLMTMAVIRLGEDRHWFFQRAHHAVADGYSGALILHRVAALYTALAAGEDAPPAEFAGLADLLAQEDEYRAGAAFAADRAHWLAKAAGRAAPVSLADGTHRASAEPLRCPVRLPAAGLDRLRALARTERTSWTTVVTAAVAGYLHRLTGADELTLGLPVTGRTTAAGRRTPGMLTNVLPLFLALSADLPVGEAVRQASAEMRHALRHQRYRNEDLRRDLGTHTDGPGGTGPLVNILAFDQQPEFAGHRGTVHYLTNGPVDDLQILVQPDPAGDGLLFTFNANPAAYDRAVLAAHATRFLRFLDAFAADRDRPIGALELLSPEENERLLREWAGDADGAPSGTLPELFAAAVARTPDAPAVEFGEEVVSYRELNGRANRLAHRLIERGVGPESVVAVSLPRSVEMVVAVLAVLKAGGAYLPVDPEYPPARVEFMLRDAAPALVLDRRQLREADSDRCPAVDPDLRGRLHPAHPAYLIYTSGSTGTPKAVVVTHRGLPALAADHLDRYGITPDARILQFASLSFDAAVVDLLNALLGGATLVLPPAGRQVGRELADFLTERAVTHAMMPPPVLATLPAGDYPALRVVITGGDVLTPDLVARWAPGRRMFNVYGPTESTVDAVVAEVVADTGGVSVPIGRPIRSTRVYVVDAGLRVVPVGVA
ncbi:AMP-binding protein, partial [Kitasatospora sp. NPDC054939]